MAKSKVALAKEAMMWRKDSPKCGNCHHFQCEIIEEKTKWGIYQHEKKKRCTFGNFATGKSCWCIKHEFKEG